MVQTYSCRHRMVESNHADCQLYVLSHPGADYVLSKIPKEPKRYNAHETVLGNGRDRKRKKISPPNHDFVQIKRRKSKTRMIMLLRIIYCELNAVEGMNNENSHMLESKVEKIFWLVGFIERYIEIVGGTDGM